MAPGAAVTVEEEGMATIATAALLTKMAEMVAATVGTANQYIGLVEKEVASMSVKYN
jgi:hypothetical protein